MPYRKTVIALVMVSIGVITCSVTARLVGERQFRTELAQARAEFAAGLRNTASRRLKHLAEQRPDQAEVMFLLGRCEAARGRFDAALSFWARIPPDSPWGPPAAL